MVSFIVLLGSLIGMAVELRRRRLATEDGPATLPVVPMLTWSLLTVASVASIVLIEVHG